MKKKVLVAPLDWGLGHATRCIPIIQILLSNNVEVMIAASSAALPLLKIEFPSLIFFELPSYKARYSVRVPLILKVFVQAPKFFFTIHKEHRAIEKIVADNKIDAIISDNRFGCFSKKVKSIFITHQVTILMPAGLQWIQGFINLLNHSLIKRFNECWVPDFSNDRVTGKLTESKKLKIKFIGMLSRFHKSDSTVEKKYDLLVLLSGPEPQRTVFERMVVKQLKQIKLNVALVRGLPGESLPLSLDIKNQLTIFNHLASSQLQSVIEQSDIVLSRSGYTTVMDLYFLEKKAIFVPTPGQTEQEHIAENLQKRGITFSMKQKDFNLFTALAKSDDYSGFSKNTNNTENVEQNLNSLLSQF